MIKIFEWICENTISVKQKIKADVQTTRFYNMDLEYLGAGSLMSCTPDPWKSPAEARSPVRNSRSVRH